MPAVPWRLLHMVALSTMAVGQPLLSLLGDNPTFFTAHDASPARIVTFAVIVAVAPAAVAGAAQLAAHALSPAAGRRVHLGFVALFLFVFVLQVVDVLPGPAVVVVLVAAVVTAGVHWLYTEYEPVRSVVSILAILPVAVLALFVFSSPTNAVIFPDEVAAAGLDELLGDRGLVDDDIDDPGAEVPTVAEQVNERFPPIHFLVFDELPWASLLDRDGGVDAARYPNFARLAATAHVFSNHTTVAFQTEKAVPSMLASSLRIEAAPVYSLYPRNLFTLLGAIYDISASDPLVDLCPPSVCDGSPPAAMVDLLADEVPRVVPSTTTVATTTVPTPPPDEEESGDGGLGLLLEDAAIVFGHLASPDGLDLGLPSIGAGWGSFGRGLGGTTDPAEASPSPPPQPDVTTTTTTTLGVEVGVAAGDGPEVDAEAIADARTALLDSLITDDTRVTDMRAEIAAITATDVPTLRFLHVLLPHVPWRLHGDGAVYADIGLPGYFEMWRADTDIAELGRQRHLLQLQFTDRLLGEYLDRLEETGTLESSTIIVTADHGISFVPGERSRGLGDGNVGGIAGVPLLYKLPGQTEAVWHDDPVSTLDIVPTLMGQLELTSPWGLEGYDLFNQTVPADRFRDADAAFWRIEIPQRFAAEVQAVADRMHAVFGDGASGSLYALGGSAGLIGQPAAAHATEPSAHCWVLDRPTTIPEPGGEIGYVFGRVEAPATAEIAFAIVVDGTVAGTARTIDDGPAHRVFAFGDPARWADSPAPEVTLHELVGGELAPMDRC